jgi:hypothetical protein
MRHRLWGDPGRASRARRHVPGPGEARVDERGAARHGEARRAPVHQLRERTTADGRRRLTGGGRGASTMSIRSGPRKNAMPAGASAGLLRSSLHAPARSATSASAVGTARTWGRIVNRDLREQAQRVEVSTRRVLAERARASTDPEAVPVATRRARHSLGGGSRAVSLTGCGRLPRPPRRWRATSRVGAGDRSGGQVVLSAQRGPC